MQHFTDRITHTNKQKFLGILLEKTVETQNIQHNIALLQESQEWSLAVGHKPLPPANDHHNLQAYFDYLI